jgi:lysophospholipase L1-like esterase
MRSPTSSSSTGSRLALLGTAVGAMAALRVASRVVALRRDGRSWRGLEHQDVIPGDEPVLRLVLLGDSAVAGHGLADAAQALPRQIAARLARRTGRAVRIEAHARSGADTADVAEEQAPLLEAAEVVVIGVGVNDALAPGRRVRRVREETARLLAAVRAQVPDAELLLLTCPDLGTAPGIPRALAPGVRWRCRTVAAAQMHAAAEAGARVVATSGPLPADVFGDDGFHPGPAAVERLAERTVAVLYGEQDDAAGPGDPATEDAPAAEGAPAPGAGGAVRAGEN